MAIMKTNLIQLLQEILGSLSSYKSRYEQMKQERDELVAEINQAVEIATQIKDMLEKWEI